MTPENFRSRGSVSKQLVIICKEENGSDCWQMHQSNLYQAEIYEQFHEIEETAFRDIIQFYERNEESIDHLEINAHMEIRSIYAMALFETGRYSDFILLAQDYLETLIYHNIQYLNQEDIYQKVLFKKAAAHYQLLEYSKAEKILWDLVRINPENKVASFLLKRSIIRNQPNYIAKLKGLSILLFLIAAGLIAGELLIVRPFFAEVALDFELARTAIFTIGFLILVFSDGVHRLFTFRKVNLSLEAFRKNVSKQ